MLVARNLKHVNNQKRFSRIRTAVGLAFFVGGSVLLAFNTIQFLLLAYGLVLAGFFFFNTGLQGVTKWGRKVRNDQLIDNQLRRLSDRYTLIHYPAIGNRNPEHVLIHETGVVVMTAKETYGRVAVNGNKYTKQGGGLFGRFFGAGGPQLGNPPVENGFDRKALLEALAGEAEARGWPTDFPIDGLVVFIAARAVVVGGEEGNPPAVKLPELLPWVQAHTRGMPIVLASEVRQQIADYLVNTGGALLEGHIDPRGAVEPDAPEKRASRRPTTPSQVVEQRSERERQARARTTAVPKAAAVAAATTVAAVPAGRRFGRRRVEETAELPDDRPAKPLSPLVPSSGMAKVKRRPRSER